MEWNNERTYAANLVLLSTSGTTLCISRAVTTQALCASTAMPMHMLLYPSMVLLQPLSSGALLL